MIQRKHPYDVCTDLEEVNVAICLAPREHAHRSVLGEPGELGEDALLASPRWHDAHGCLHTHHLRVLEGRGGDHKRSAVGGGSCGSLQLSDLGHEGRLWHPVSSSMERENGSGLQALVAIRDACDLKAGTLRRCHKTEQVLVWPMGVSSSGEVCGGGEMLGDEHGEVCGGGEMLGDEHREMRLVLRFSDNQAVAHSPDAVEAVERSLRAHVVAVVQTIAEDQHAQVGVRVQHLIMTRMIRMMMMRIM